MVLAGQKVDPNLIYDQEGGVIVVWAERRNGDTKVLAQRITPAGSRAWSQDLFVADNSSTAQEEPDISADGMGGYFIAWADKRVGVSHIYLQKINILGQRLWANDVQVSLMHQSKYQFHPSLASDYFGGIYVAWEDAYGGYIDPDFGEILYKVDVYIAVIDGSGTRETASDLLITGTCPAWHHTLDLTHPMVEVASGPSGCHTITVI